jgi:murein DD-endopeptidase MepM/ murein hydrolase activator NlpD
MNGRNARVVPYLAGIILAGWLLAGCASPSGSPVEEQAIAPSSTPVLLPEWETAEPVVPGDDTGDQPLRFTFPTPNPAPVSAWRPPLYDVPWALGPYDHFYFKRPIAVDEVNWPLANYRYGDFFPDTDIVHTGIDIDATRGTPVIAAGSGRVVWAGFGLYKGANATDDPYGLAVAIKHNFGYNGRYLYTIYAHMDRVDVQVDQKVETGDPLGIVGNTGNTTGPHLHFEVRVETNSFFVTRNPELWLAPPQGWGVLVGRLTQNDGTPIRKLEVFVESQETGQIWSVRTYGPVSVNSDDTYKENLVLSDLPEGSYKIRFQYGDSKYTTEIKIHPGAISYFTFRPGRGFRMDPPATPSPEDWLGAVAAP